MEDTYIVVIGHGESTNYFYVTGTGEADCLTYENNPAKATHFSFEIAHDVADRIRALPAFRYCIIEVRHTNEPRR